MGNVNNEIQVDHLLVKMVNACVHAAKNLDTEMAGADYNLPNQYVIPQMDLKLQLQMSYSDKTIKGVFVKSHNKEETSSTSSIELKLVAIPRKEP